MFYIDIPPAKYSDPWNTSFVERYCNLLKGKPKIAYYYENPDNSTFRYRVYNMIQSLRKIGGVSASFFHSAEHDKLAKVIGACDIFVICRCRYSGHLNGAITLAKNLGKKVYFDIDDMVYNPDYISLILSTLDQDLDHPDVWDFWFAHVGRLGGTLKLCDAVLTTNKYLSNIIHRDTGKPVHVIQNYLNDEQLEISAGIYADKEKSDFRRSDQVYLGYFSGTPTHNKDFDIIAPAMSRIFDEYPEVMLRIVGFIELKDGLEKYKDRIEFYPLHDFINLQRLIGLVEINLVPLQDNIFTNCKSELKFFEAAIVGTVTVATPAYTFENSIRDGENGFLSTSIEWYDKIKHVLDNFDKYQGWARVAHDEVLERYNGQTMGEKIANTLLK